MFMGGEAREIERCARGAPRRSPMALLLRGEAPARRSFRLSSPWPTFSCRLGARGENTPFKVYTYLASGRPLVATRIPSHTQVLDDATAFVVDATAAGLAGGVQRALAEPAAAASRALRGREMLEERYSAARYSEKVRAAYDMVAATLP